MPALDEILQRLPGREGWKMIDDPSAELKQVTNTITQKTTNEPTGRYFVTIAGPNGATQRMIVRPDAEAGAGLWGFEGLEAAHELPTTPASGNKSVSGSQYGTWEPDPANPGQYRQVVPPQAGISDPNEARSKAIKAQTDEADRDRKIANERATGMYVDDATLANIRHAESTDANAAARLKEDIRNNTARQKLEDDKLHLDNQKFLLDLAKNPVEIAKIGAETGKIGAETDLTKAQLAALGIKTESDVERARQAGLLDQAQAAKINAELKKPEAVAAAVDQPYLTRRDPVTQQLLTEPNPNYQGPKAPTTRGELAQRTALLQQQMMAMKDKIAADKSIPPDQQSARFNQWYDQNVAPQIGALEQQQQAIAQDEAQKALEAQRAGLTAAAGAIQSTAPYRVGPGYGQAFEQIVQATAQGKRAPNVNLSGVSTYKAPSIDQSVQDLLAGKAATAPLPGMDFQSLLGRNQWVPGGGPPAAAPAPAGPTPEQGAALAAAGAQAAAASANPANSPFGAIGNDPMLAAIQARNRALASQQTAAATGQAQTPFGALNSMPRAGAMPMANGAGPLPYNPSAFSGVMPLLPGFDYSQLQTQWQPS